MNTIPRVAAIHDLSGFGRCSLSVILPTLSVMGVQACPVPTAVLSAHLAFGEVAIRDLTDFIEPCLNNYKNLNLEFDCIYSGFLGSQQQVDHCLDFFKSYPDSLIVVDPVMGDHGKAYKTYTSEMQKRMSELVYAADIITPNLTEAFILLKEPYDHTPLNRTQVKSMLAQLSKLGPNRVVITSVPLVTGEMVNVGYDKNSNAYWMVKCDYMPVAYPGTGDLFASVLVGAVLGGDSLPMAIGRSTYFVEQTIKTTFSYGTDVRYGVMLEKTLPALVNRTAVKDYQIL